MDSLSRLVSTVFIPTIAPTEMGYLGDMMCFRNLKQEYLQVKSKQEFFHIHDHFERQVQETWLCDEFELRVPGTGYRG